MESELSLTCQIHHAHAPSPLLKFPTAESGDGTVRARTHTALRASHDTTGGPHHAAPAPAAVAADTQSRESFVLVLVIVRAHGDRLGTAGRKDGGSVTGVLAR